MTPLPFVRLLPLLSLTVGCTSRQAYFSAAGDDPEGAIVTEIGAATETVQVAIYTFTSEPIKEALLDAMTLRGVTVNLVADAGQTFTISDQETFLDELTASGAEVRVANGFGGGIMHNKFAVIDSATVLTGSFNWTRSAEYENDENLLVLADPTLARAYSDAFQDLWARAEN